MKKDNKISKENAKVDKEENNRKKKYLIKKHKVDFFVKILLRFMVFLSASVIFIIFIFVVFKGVKVFLPGYEYGRYSLKDFLTGTVWRQDRAEYGALFIIINTLISSLGAAIIAFPLAILTALFIVKVAPKRLKETLKTVINLLAAIPSVVYGVFASAVIVSLVDSFARALGFSTFGGNSLLAVILLLGIMILPTITAISITAIESVDKDLELGSFALGATKMQTNFKIVLMSAKSGLFAGLILGLGRAFGEATAVSMVAGNKFYGPTLNPFDITRTLTSTMLAGLKETSGIDYDIRFSIGIVLMVIIVMTNLILNKVKDRIGSDANG